MESSSSSAAPLKLRFKLLLGSQLKLCAHCAKREILFSSNYLARQLVSNELVAARQPDERELPGFGQTLVTFWVTNLATAALPICRDAGLERMFCVWLPSCPARELCS